MKLLKRFIFTLVIIVVLSPLPACSKKEVASTEAAEEERAEIEAAMMQGRSTAREFLNQEWKDTLQLMHHLLKAKAVQSEYLISKRPKSAEAFDSAFISTVRSVDPQLAATITSTTPVPTSPQTDSDAE